MFSAFFEQIATHTSQPGLSYEGDPASFSSWAALYHVPSWQIDENTKIQFFGVPDGNGLSTVHSYAYLSDDETKDPCTGIWAKPFNHMKPYAVEQFIRFAEREALCLEVFKTRSKEALRKLEDMNANPLPSLPHPKMTSADIMALPLPYLITTKKFVKLHMYDEDDNLVSIDAYEKKKEEAEERKYDKKKQKEYEKFEEEKNDIIEASESKGIFLEEVPEEEEPFEYNETMLYRGLPPHIQEQFEGKLELVGWYSQLVAVLETDDAGKPYYAIKAMTKGGPDDIGDIRPYNGELVGLVTRFLSNAQESALQEHIDAEPRHRILERFSDCDCDIIEEYAEIFDAVHIASLPSPDA